MGWVWKQDEAWRGAYRDEAGKQHTKSFKRKIDASRWVTTEEAKVVRGDWVDPRAGRVTFASFYADLAPRQVWVSSTRENADLAAAGVTFGDMPLRSIRRSHIEGWVKHMTTKLASTTIDTRFTIVRGVFRAAVADRLIPSDPTIGVVLPRKRKAEAAMRIPSSVDVAKLLNAADPPNRPKSRPGFTAYVALCAFAGLRRGEALGVQVRDIDFLGRTLRVTRQIQRAKMSDIAEGKDLVEAVGGVTVLIRAPKYESERTIYLADELVTILSQHVGQHSPDGDPARWLFDEGGKPWQDNLVDYRWRSTRTAAGTNHKLHDLRHYFASGLIAAGCDVVTVQRSMGHASATTTLGTYAHLWPTVEDKTRAAASGMAATVLATSLPQVETQ
ncbi:phage integrase family protein [Nocardioides sp. CF8]|uniref:tyrosine-type recombinase/integrase n=1 Tax=Nocardioides sp. CF8 TaxID=110319 RepID=UPI0003311E1D|nr:site-specific integrase [Nocardioides sp. CF8]EON25702.1 phage integrase family protein [Nocardioides sp. CF8]